MSYFERYSWFRPIGDYCIGHDDGAVSLMIKSRGFDIGMSSDQTISSSWNRLRALVTSLDQNCVLEVHYFREADDSVAQAYLARNDQIVRAHEIGRKIREDIAEHLAKFGRSNTQCFVLTLPKPWRRWRVTQKLAEQDQSADQLKQLAESLLRYIPGGEIAFVGDYEQLIGRSYYRDRWLKQGITVDHRFPLNEQIIHTKPQEIGEGVLKIGSTYTQVGLLTLYPDAQPGWFEAYAALSEVDVHISQIIQPMNTQQGMAQADQQVLTQESLRSDRGGEYVIEKIKAVLDFKQFVAKNNLSLFKSCFIVHFHCADRHALRRCWQQFEDEMNREGCLVSNADIALAFFRFAQPGQGYRTSFMRPDHELEVANMMPMVAFDQGVEPDCLRLTYQGQLVGLSYPKNSVNNAFTVAKSDSGKGVSKTATILETFPLGTDWYIAEVGNTYQWAVEALGGQYCHLDPSKVVVNPLPEYAHADLNAAKPFPPEIVTPTLQAIRYLLLDDTRQFQVEEQAAAETAMYLLYSLEELPSEGTPNLVEYAQMLMMVGDDDSEQVDQRRAADRMAKKLNSFLSTGAGSIFAQADNFTISDHIFGVDFKPLIGDEKLMAFYLVFITLRYAQLCFANKRTSRILVDELHLFNRAHPEMMQGFVSSISRMGRKDAGAFDGVTQSLSDIAKLDTEILEQMSHRTLLYTQANHDTLLEAVPSISQRAFDCWRSYPDPKSIPDINYRQGLHMMGDRAWDLYLTFPSSVMAIANTDPDVLALKDQIGQTVKDPFERILALQKALALRAGERPVELKTVNTDGRTSGERKVI